MRLLGTPAYMAPERIGHPSDVDPRADVYGVGALIFFLAAGRAPFAGDDEADDPPSGARHDRAAPARS